jgi:CHAT domain-containing protein/tetratricopeptide (TPR) repeat protein
MQLCALEAGFHAVRCGRALSGFAGNLGWCALILSAVCSAQTPSPADRAQTQRRLEQARALQEKGLEGQARKLYESLLPELRSQNNKPELARVLNDLSLIASASGDNELAIARARESAGLFRQLSDQGGEARAVNNLGKGELNRGEYTSAKAHFEESLKLYQGIHDAEGEIKQYNNIGNVFYYQSRYLDALEAYEEAMKRVERSAGKPWSARLRQGTMLNLGTLFQRLGREEKALDLYRQVQQARQALMPNEEAQLYANLGALYRRLGDPVKALEIYRQAQDIFTRRGNRDGQVGVLINIGIALAVDLGNASGALESFTQALALAQQTQSRREATQAHLYRGESLFRLGELISASDEFTSALAGARGLGTSEEEWKSLYGLGRVAERAGQRELAANYLRQAIARIESIRSRLQLSLKSEFLGDKRDVYDSLIALSLDKPDAVELFDLMERSRARSFQDRLQPSPQANAISSPTPSLNDVQNRLDDVTLLLEFWIGPRSAAVVWITRSGFGIVHQPLSPDDLDELSGFSRDLPNSSREIWRGGSKHLGKLLLSGIEPLENPGLRHLLVTADGILSAFPFEALAMGNTLLVERFDISYLPSSSILLRPEPVHQGSWHWPWKRGLLAFGDPTIFSHGDPSFSEFLPEEGSRQPLPTSAAEVRAIASFGPGRSEIHLGGDDLKKYLLQGSATGVPLLHLSTHATADLDNPERSRILFSSENKESRPDYLFLREVYDLDLRGVELATLSACDTERGKIIRGEGSQGFSRALLSAGSRTAVTTLWRVADEPTSDFMKQFYYALGQGKSKSDALRAAKLKFLQSGSPLAHPRHWAAFVLSGDGRQPLTRTFSWSMLLTPPAAALLLLSMIAHRRVRAQRISSSKEPQSLTGPPAPTRQI